MTILNGFINSDLPGAFTHFTPRGVSVIDHILASPSLLLFLSDFQVIPYHESDHLPIQLFLDSSLAKGAPNNPLTYPHPRFKWSPSQEDALHRWANQEPILRVCWLRLPLPQWPYQPMPLSSIHYHYFLVLSNYPTQSKALTLGSTWSVIQLSHLSDSLSSRSVTIPLLHPLECITS